MSPLIVALALYLVILLSVVVYAFFKGGNSERSGAITILMAALLSQVAAESGQQGQHWNGPEIGVMIVDVAVFIAFFVIAYRSTRFWPIWAAASQLVAVLTHVAIILNPSIVPALYVTAQPLWAFPVIAALAIGTRAHQRSLRQ